METHDAVVLFTRTMLAREAVSRRSAMRMPISLGRSVSWKEARGTSRRSGGAQRGLKSFCERDAGPGWKLSLRRRFTERVTRSEANIRWEGSAERERWERVGALAQRPRRGCLVRVTGGRSLLTAHSCVLKTTTTSAGSSQE